MHWSAIVRAWCLESLAVRLAVYAVESVCALAVVLECSAFVLQRDAMVGRLAVVLDCSSTVLVWWWWILSWVRHNRQWIVFCARFRVCGGCL